MTCVQIARIFRFGLEGIGIEPRRVGVLFFVKQTQTRKLQSLAGISRRDFSLEHGPTTRPT